MANAFRDEERLLTRESAALSHEAPVSLEELEETIRDQGIELVRFETPDLNGISRGKSVVGDHFGAYAAQGLALVSDIYCWDHECWVATGTGFGEDLTFADLVLRPDRSTFCALPHLPGEARVICDVEYADGRPVEASPRRVLARVLDRAAELGLTVRMQVEYEFYLLDPATLQPPFPGTDITTTLTNQRLPVLRDLVRQSKGFGLAPNTLNQEWGPTQYELNFDSAVGIVAGDQAFTHKTYAKEIAGQHELRATFMTKPFADSSGSSSHLHLSLFDSNGSNLFADEDDADGVSDDLRSAVAGQLAHARALSALLGPTVNCAKRYRKGTYAPASVTWGFENRSVAVRVKAWRGERTHVENRLGGGSSNPYLALAGVLAASLDGIHRGLEAPDPIRTNAYHLEELDLLPGSLDESLEEFTGDDVLLEWLDPEFVKAFVALKRHEIAKARAACPDYGQESWHRTVTDWERQQFLALS
jgi:glutamine synthetase